MHGCFPYETKICPHCIRSTSDTLQIRVRHPPNQAFGDLGISTKTMSPMMSFSHRSKKIFMVESAKSVPPILCYPAHPKRSQEDLQENEKHL